MSSPRFSLSVLRQKVRRFLNSIKPARRDLDFRCQTPSRQLDHWNEPSLEEIDNERHTVEARELVGEPLQTARETAETWNLNLPQTATQKQNFIIEPEVSIQLDCDDAVSGSVRPESPLLPEAQWLPPSNAYVSQNSYRTAIGNNGPVEFSPRFLRGRQGLKHGFCEQDAEPEAPGRAWETNEAYLAKCF
ncbi:hypothetical protein TWF481_002790 [Arthrobotrys musiformis]|uniref:Uncharacterized protein n=1 Tax=Arthrobotrys musiformis TaxID=47236 RepID=A0AAV9VRF2_9PEZI